MTSLLRQQRYASFAVGGVSVGLAYLYAKRLVWKSTADLADRLPGPPSAPIATLERPQIFGTHFKLAAVQHWNARFNSHIAGSSSSEGAQHASSEPPVESVRPGSYPFQRIESYWQGYWESTGSFITPQFALLDTSKPKYYVLDMFPYPSGSGLHVGHPSGYTATDVVARYKRARGYNVLHPMGWDAFGLPAEQYAMATGTHPAASTRANVARFRGQLRRLGLSYDWSRELSTAEPEYYRWTQHAFLSALRRGLAYRREAPVNWCPALGTVLANEEVVQGRSERGSHPVQRLPMKQWTLAITRHAERLLRGLDGLDWDSHVLDMQRNWIGRSEGALVEFEVERGKGERHGPPNVRTLSAFTTRPDTLFGATYVAVAPEHPQALLWTTAGQRRAVDAYVAAAASKSDLERADAAAGKSGVWTGSWVRHPATSELLPLWVADYVLGGVGTGALMGVPSHDLRDAAFAEAFDLPFRAVVEDDAGEGGERPSSSPSPSAGPRTDRVYTGVAGRVKNSRSPEGSLCADGLSVPEAQRAVVAWLQARGRGRPHVQYKLRDWLFARQRYWGEPFPVAYEQLADGSLAEEPAPLPEDSLPLRLPPLSDFRPTGTPEGPLSKLVDWVRTSLPGSDDPPRPALRETSTMPQWAGSCWYFLRFVDPWNATAPADAEAQRYWLPVDLYVGGAEHAVLHLLYARFWQQMLFDAGAATCEEPFRKLVSQGMVLGEVEYTAPCLAAEGADPLLHGSAWDPDAVRPLSPEEEAKSPHATPVRVPAELVRADGAGGFCLASRPDVRVAAKAHKMSKSRGNVVSPDEVVASHGADSLRLYVLFMGPLRENKAWSAAGVEGVHRFLSRFWRLAHASIESWGEMERGEEESSRLEPATPLYQLQAMHRTIAKVTEDIEHLRFNTAIAAQMEWVNAANKWAQPPSRECLEAAVQLLAPFAPHVAEELWRAIGHPVSLHDEPWPAARPELLAARTLTLAVQVQGKARASVQLEAGEEPLTQDAVLRAAMDVPAVKKRVEAAGGVKKVVYVPNKVINIIL